MKDVGTIEVYGHLKIRDPNTNTIILNKRVDQPLKDKEKNDRYFNPKNNRNCKDNK